MTEQTAERSKTAEHAFAGALSSFFSRLELAAYEAAIRGKGGSIRAAAVLCVDIAGFTALAERFSEEGAQGAERLSRFLNEALGRVILEVTALGGDILGFAGDSVWAAWRLPDHVDAGESELEAAVALACLAARNTQAAARRPMPFDEPLTLRTVVGVGELSVLAAIDPTQFSVTVGESIADTSLIFAAGRVGDVVISARAAELVRRHGTLTPLASGAWRLESIDQVAVTEPPPAVAIDARLAQCLSQTLPPHITQRLSGRGAPWFAEFRHVSALFIGLPSFQSLSSERELELSAAIDIISKNLRRSEGEQHHVVMDEKGLSVIGLFGAPPLSHADDAARAVRAALAIHLDLSLAGIPSSIGVASGRVFCDICGTEARRYLAVAGPAMNLAARLMQAAAQGVLCDVATTTAAGPTADISFGQPTALSVKGKREAIPAFRPSLDPAASGIRLMLGARRGMVGRARELELLDASLRTLVERGQSAVMVLEGEAGIGKSRVAMHFAIAARDAGVRLLMVTADSLDGSVPYFALAPAFKHCLGLDAAGRELEARRAAVLAMLEGHDELLRWLPLLNGTLALELPETETTRALTEQARAQKIRELLAEIFSLQGRATLLVVEDAQWLDSPSWDFIAEAARSCPSLLVLLTCRPFERPSKGYEGIIELPFTQRLQLEPFSSGEVRELMASRLEVQGLPEELCDLVWARSAGNPMFAVQLAFAMRELGILQVAGDRCSLAPGVNDVARALDVALERRGVPATLQGIITSRLDRMPSDQQLVLKIASVLGSSFPAALLCDVYRSIAPGTDPLQALRSLPSHDVVLSEGEGDDAVWAFRHVLIKEAIYGTIPFAQREQMHEIVARWYEATEDSHTRHGLLGHHWARAGDDVRALRHFDQAGLEALRAHAVEEAVAFLTTAQKLDEGATQPASDETRKRWALRQLDLGAAHVAWSKYGESRAHLERGLRLFGRWVPATAWSASFSIVLELMRQLAYRTLGRLLLRGNRGSPGLLRQQARAFEGLTDTYFNLGQNAVCLNAALRSLNLAELSGPSAELARGYASFGAIMGFVPWVSLARRYCMRAAAVARELRDKPAEAWVAVATGVLEAGLGEWKAAEVEFKRTHELGTELGDSRRCDDSSENLAAVQYLRGELGASMATAQRQWRSAHRRNDRFMQADSLRRQAYCLLALNRTTEAAELVDRLIAMRQQEARKKSRELNADAYLLRALVHARRGELIAARRDAEVGNRILAASSFMFYDVLLEHSSLAEVCLFLREAGELGAAPGRAACRRLRGFARSFPCARPAAQLWTGLEAELSGSREKAQRLWSSAIELASSRELRYFEAISLFESGSRLQKSDRRRIERLTLSLQILRQLGERFYAARAAEALGLGSVDVMTA